MNNISDFLLPDISQTMLLTLYARAIESKSKNPILNDAKSVEIVNKMNSYLSNSQSLFHQKLIKGDIAKSYVKTVALRSKLFDKYVRNFLKKTPTGTIVNLGCGLDTRFFRVDNNIVEWYDLDFTEVINIKKYFLKETDRYSFISSAIFDFKWMNALNKKKNKSFLFIAEGVFIFLSENEVRRFTLELQRMFPGCEIVFDVNNSHLVNWIQKIYNVFIRSFVKDELYLANNVKFKWGIKNEHEIEKWNKGIEFIDEMIYSDYAEKRSSLSKLLCFFDFFRKAQYIVHYKLN